MIPKVIIDIFLDSWVLWLLFLLAILYRLFRSDLKDAGTMGENEVARLLNQLPMSKYKVIHNLLLFTKKGSSQIDHVVISIYGIFVIETKNYQGEILGKESSKEWIQQLHGNTYPFLNPIYQNNGHIIAIKNVLDKKNLPFISIITFSDRAKLNVDTKTSVVYYNDLLKIIKGYQEKVLSQKEVQLIKKELTRKNKDSRYNRRKHIRFVKKRAKQKS